FYTISSPDADGEVEITVDAGPESGAVAGALAGLEPGATVTIAGPFGDQYYDDEPRPVLLAGGPGVGPAVAIAGRALAAGNEAVVVYRDDAPIHRDRLDALRDRGVSVTVLDADASLTDAVADALERDGQVFVYGFEGFVDDALDAVVAAGDDPDAATVENFG
ncbi:oxidoreductase, partial [Halobacteriales archaeon SW_7_68_16]